jgi:GntR family transcriptional regulator/MocR family aminotransferase
MKNDYPFNWCIPDLDKKRCSSQIEAFIIENIKSGNLCAGDAVPGYRKLAELNSIGFNSIRRAYARLITGHWLETRNGAGTFVSEKETEQNSAGRFGSVADEFPAGLDLMQLMSSKRANALQPFTFVGTDFPHPALFPEDRFFRYCHKHRNMSAHLSQSQLLTAYGGHYLKQAVMDDLNKNRGFDLNLNLLQINNGREDTLKMAFRMLLVKPGELVINTSLHDPVVI